MKNIIKNLRITIENAWSRSYWKRITIRNSIIEFLIVIAEHCSFRMINKLLLKLAGVKLYGSSKIIYTDKNYNLFYSPKFFT